MTARRDRVRAALHRTATGLALAVLLWTSLPAQAVQAHASFLGADPEDGAALAEPPETITLHFNEPVQPVDETMRLVDADGVDHPIEATSRDNDVVVAMGHEVPDGGYSLNWRVISADAHPISGVVGFTVGDAAAAPPIEADGDEAEAQEGRTAVMAVAVLHYLGLLVFAGLVCFRVAIARELCPPRPRHRLLLASGATAIVAAAVAVPIGALDLTGLPLDRIADHSAWSGAVQSAALAILALTTVGLGAAYWCLARGRGRWAGPTALGASSVALAAPVLVGHSMLFEPRWGMVAADVAHLFAGAIWTGGLLGLLILLRNARLRGDAGNAAATASAVARFSTWAGVTVGLLGASGLIMALMIHREWSSLFGSHHGRALLVKLALVALALALALAGWNRFRLVPLIESAGDRAAGLLRLRRVLAVEAAAVALAIAVTGVLVNLSPDGAAQEPQSSTVTLRQDLGEGELAATLEPGRTGDNTILLELTDAEGLPIEPLEPPLIRANLPAEDFGPVEARAEADPDGEGHLARLHLPMSGEWSLEIRVRVSQFEEHHASLTVTVD